MLVVIIALMPCLNAYAFTLTMGSAGIMALLALSGVTLMSANIPDSVAQNMYRDISTIASNTSHALYESANAIIDFTADYSVKVANATGEMIEVSGVNLSNAIGSFKNYLTYKNVNGAYDGLVVDNYSNRLDLQKMASLNTGLSVGLTASYMDFSDLNTQLMSTFSAKLSNVLVSNTILHSTKRAYNMALDGFLIQYPEFYRLDRPSQYTSYADFTADISSAYNWLTGTFANYISTVTFENIALNLPGGYTKCNVEFITFLLKDGIMNLIFVRNLSGDFVAYRYNDGETYKNTDWSKAKITALPFAYFVGLATNTSTPSLMNVIIGGSTSSSMDYTVSAVRNVSLTVWNDTSATSGTRFADVQFDDTVSFSSSAVSVPRVTGDAIGQDVYGVPDIPESVISGQYNPDVADKIGAVVGGADVIGLNVPVVSGQDVYNPSIDALIGSGTLTSDVVIDGTTVATGTDVITGVQTAVGDLVSTGDTVLDLDTTPGTPGGTPSFPDVFPGLWDWVNGLVDNALQWFIFCGDVFSALPGVIKYTFLGGMTSVLAVGVIKKLLF